MSYCMSTNRLVSWESGSEAPVQPKTGTPTSTSISPKMGRSSVLYHADAFMTVSITFTSYLVSKASPENSLLLSTITAFESFWSLATASELR